MPHRILEVCVDSTASAVAAKAGGADRLELCADLAIGGTTPSAALVRQVKAETGLPVRALLRPRAGDFCYDRWELAQMAELAAGLVAAGADGIVTGVLDPAGDLDLDAMQHICTAARREKGGVYRRRALFPPLCRRQLPLLPRPQFRPAPAFPADWRRAGVYRLLLYRRESGLFHPRRRHRRGTGAGPAHFSPFLPEEGW